MFPDLEDLKEEIRFLNILSSEIILYTNFSEYISFEIWKELNLEEQASLMYGYKIENE